MRKGTLALAGILLLATGGAIGWFAAKGSGTTSEQGVPPGKPVVRYRAGSSDLLATAPSWEEWKYPGSRVHTKGSTGGTKLGEIEVGGAERATLLTADGFDKVWPFYKDKCKLRDPGDGSAPLREPVDIEQSVPTVKIFDDVRGHSFEGPKSEALQARGFSVQSLRYSLTGFVYRPEQSDSTCILLVYRPSTEFIGLLKDKVAKD